MASSFGWILSHEPKKKVLTEEQLARSVVVSNIAPQTEWEDLIIHFQRKKYGGGDIDHIHIPRKGSAVITFESSEDAARVLEYSHILGESNLRLEPFIIKDPPEVFNIVEARGKISELSPGITNLLHTLEDSTKVTYRLCGNGDSFVLSGTFSQMKAARGFLFRHVQLPETGLYYETPNGPATQLYVFELVSAELCVERLSRIQTINLLNEITKKTDVKWAETIENVILSGTFKALEESRAYLQQGVNHSNGIVVCNDLTWSRLSDKAENKGEAKQSRPTTAVENRASHPPEMTKDDTQAERKIVVTDRPKKKEVGTKYSSGLTESRPETYLGATKNPSTTNLKSVQSREKGARTKVHEELQRQVKINIEQQRLLGEAYQEKTSLEERIRSLEQQMEEERNSHMSTERELRSAVSAADHRLQEENQRKTTLEESLRSLEQRMEVERNSHLSTERELQSALSAADHRLQEENQQKTTLEESLRGLEQRMEEEQNRHLSTERELRSALSEADHRLQEENQQKTTLEESLRGLEQRMEEEQNRHLSTERELRSALSAADHRLQEENQQKTTLEESLRSLEQRMEEERNSHMSSERELRSSLSAAENALTEYQRHQSRDWIIQREEVLLSEKILGIGAWGNVREGKFRGCLVAVKEIHELILSDYNRGLFEREMSIASRCRHPNLLQFIGATNDEGSPLFVTELLDTSLHHILHERNLNHGEIVKLALDVAKGLNYLHLSTPLPIMHRDIKSANVLLLRRVNSWRAKLSDYGSANFLRQSMTVNPGTLIYSAPEAFTPRQSTKVDVYSFGVLLCEMCIRQQPDPQELHKQIGRVNQNALRGLIQRCVERDPEARPTMSEVIHELEQLELS